VEGGKTPLTRLARGKRKRRKKRGAFPTGSGLTPVRPGIKERTNMSKLTGCNYDVNEELPQVTDPEQPDDGEFEAWLDSLNERTANGGADRLPHRTRKQLYFATLKANGWTPKPKPPALRPLWQTIQHAWQTIRCARLRSLPLHRRVFCLLFFAPGRYYLAAAILGLLVFGSHLAAPQQNTDSSDRPGKCSTLNGKQICDGTPWQDKHGYGFPGATKPAKVKAPKITHVVCADNPVYKCPATLNTDDMGIDEASDTISKQCHWVLKCRRVNGPDPTIWLTLK
jgi:hypothetical protein